MNGLRELQTDFAAALFEADATRIATRIRAAGLSGVRRVGIYRHHVEASLLKALSVNFPVVERLVGEGFFRFAASRYMALNPLRSASLQGFGAAFADFLASFEPASALPYIQDVARLEWARQEVLQESARDSIDTTALAAVPDSLYGSLGFTLSPACRLLCTPFPVLRIWTVNQPDHPGDATVRLDEGADRLLLTRRDVRIEMLRLSPGEHALLSALAQNLPLADATEQALRAEPTMELGDCLRAHVARGTLAGFRLHPLEPEEE